MPWLNLKRPGWADLALLLALSPVVLLPQLVGGVHPHVALGAAVVEIVAAVLHVVGKSRRGAPLIVSVLAAPLALGLAATLLQLVPLPKALLGRVAPVAAEGQALTAALLPSDVASAVAPVTSLDPPETAFAAVRLAGALLLFLVVSDACRSRQRRSLVYRALLLSGLLLFVVALGHRLFHVHGPWGRFTMRHVIFYAPMVNPNQLARVFGALSLVASARALGVRSRTEAMWSTIGGVLCGAAVFLTLSRGGALVFVFGLILLAALVLRERAPEQEASQRGQPRPGRRLLLQGGGVASLLVALVVGREAIVREAATLEDTTVESSKMALYRPALGLLREHWPAGVGNNAFGVAFAPHAGVDLYGGGITFTHAENIVVATLVEHGVPIGGALIAAALAVGAFLLLRFTKRADFAPVPALVFLVVADLFDFALESTAGLFLAATLLALAAGALDEEKARRVRADRAWPALVIVVLAVAACGHLAVAQWRRSLDAVVKADAGRSGFERSATLQRALAAHPFDAHYAYLLAVEARTRREPLTALRFANRALLLSPSPVAHVEAARALAALGRLDQALIEYKAALREGRPTKALMAEIAARTPLLEQRRRALPDLSAAYVAMADRLVVEGRLDEAQALLDDAALLPDASPSVLRRGVEVALKRVDGEGAQARLRPRIEATPVDGGLLVLWASARALTEGLARTYDESASWLPRTHDVVALLRWRVATAMQLGRLDEASRDLDELRRRAADPSTVDHLDRLEADLLGKRGDKARQLRLLERMAGRSPADAAIQLRLAALHLELGQTREARTIVGRVTARDPRHAGAAALARKVEAAEERERRRKIEQLVDDGG
jgi:tetratricopeptide (TPR) repeat protein